MDGKLEVKNYHETTRPYKPPVNMEPKIMDEDEILRQETKD